MKRRFFSIFMVLCMVLSLFSVSASGEGSKDVWIDGTTDASVTTVSALIQITGSGGAQAGVETEKTLYIKEIKGSGVSYSNPKPQTVENEINAARNMVNSLASGIKEQGKAGDFSISETESTGKTWDNRKYETFLYNRSLYDGDQSEPIGILFAEDTSDDEKATLAVTDSAHREQISKDYPNCAVVDDLGEYGQNSRVHYASGDYGKETFYRVKAKGQVDGYDITVKEAEHGTVTVDSGFGVSAASVSEAVVKITAEAEEGWVLETIAVFDEDGHQVLASVYGLSSNTTKDSVTFTMPARAVEVSASFAEQKEFRLGLGTTEGGAFTVSGGSYHERKIDSCMNLTVKKADGDQVTLTAAAADGYEFKGFYEGVYAASGSMMGFVDSNNETLLSDANPYTFTIEKDTAVQAVFAKKEPEPEPEPDPEPEPEPEPTGREDEIPGDVDANGVVDGRDAVRLMKYLAGEIDPETNAIYAINDNNADVTGDGVLDGLDLVRLTKYLGGEKVTLEYGAVSGDG